MLAGGVAAAAGDTYSSELGAVLGPDQPVLVTSGRRVPRGTNGAVSLAGTLASGLGGALVGVAHLALVLLLTPATLASQWTLIPQGTPGPSPIPPPTSNSRHFGGLLCGLACSLLDSYLGGVFQFSGEHSHPLQVSSAFGQRGTDTGLSESGAVVELEGPGVKRICGRDFLSNDSVNLISNGLTALVAPELALLLYTATHSSA